MTGRIDLIIKTKDGYEAIKYKLSAPRYTSKARKAENLPEASIELAFFNACLCEKYDGIKVSYYHLKNKDDKGFELVNTFNNKPNKNIVTADFKNTTAESTLSSLNNLDLALILKCKEESAYSLAIDNSNCTFCAYKTICSQDSLKPNEPLACKKKGARLKPDKKQKQIINQIKGPLRIVAGPGSGKTGTLQMRFAAMLKSGIKPYNILLLSFSNKAVEELKERIINETGVNEKDLRIFTYNSFCFSILKKYQALLGFKEPLRLIRKHKLCSFIIEYLNSIDYTGKLSFSAPLADYGVVTKLSDIVSTIINSNDGFNKQGILSKYDKLDPDFIDLAIDTAIFVANKMKENNLITYSHQIKLTKELFDKFPNLINQIAYTYKYIMVDEFQDTNEMHSDILYKLAMVHENLCIVGDDDQSIYGFNGALVDNILNFNKHFKCTDYILDTNYRSTPSIVGLANEIICQNKKRLGKELKAHNKIDSAIEYHIIDDLSLITDFIKNFSNVRFSDISIIARKNNTLNKVADVLSSHAILYIKPLNKLNEAPDFIRLFNYLKATIGDADNITLYQYNKFHNEVPAVFCENYADYVKEQNTQAILNYEIEKQCFVSKFSVFDDAIDYMFNKNSTCKSVQKAILAFIKDEGISSMHELYNEFCRVILYDEDITYEIEDKYDAINLLTAHAAKGKEFDAVIIPDINEFEDMSEEDRRVLFVALTRAKSKLVILEKPAKVASKYAQEIKNYLGILKDNAAL